MNAGNPIYLLDQTTSEYRNCLGGIAQYLQNADLVRHSQFSSGSPHEKNSVQTTRQSPRNDSYPRRRYFLEQRYKSDSHNILHGCYCGV